MRIYVVRHGESTANKDADEYRQALQQIKLTQTGRLQATQSGKDFARHLDGLGGPPAKLAIFCSPYERARQTMELFLTSLRNHGHANAIGNIIATNDLGEARIGDYEGYNKREEYPQLLAENKVRHGEGYRSLTDEDRLYIKQTLAGDTYNAKPPGGESGREVCERVRHFLADNQVLEKGEDMVLFTHSVMGCAFKSVLTSTDDAGCAEIYNNRTRSGNGEILMFEGDPEHGFTCTTLPNTLKSIDPAAPSPPHYRADRDHLHLTPSSNGQMFGR
jgi:broad specificity phosphatase PhoE